MSFKNLGICEPILRVIEEYDFSEATYIQEKSIPPILEGKDIIGQSATGSGKTLAFGCGIIQNLKAGSGIGAIVLTPTRELAEQVCSALKDFSKYQRLKFVPIYGGVSINPQMNDLRRADVVVATPGRLLDHIDRRTIDLSRVKILVLDEADRMVDMGFIDDVNKIIRQCPKTRQTLLFSATLSPDIEKIKNKYMNNPISITAKTHVDPSKLKQIYYDVRSSAKFSLLIHLLHSENSGLVLIFCNTRNQVDFITKNINYNKLDAIAIHGGFTQTKRSASLQKLKSNKASILVCTDVAARGLDIPGVSHIYNYDMPADGKEYIHRIGRTARAGKEGKVINLVSPRDHENFSNVFRINSTLNIESVDLPQVQKALMKQETMQRRPSTHGRNNFHQKQGRGRRN